MTTESLTTKFAYQIEPKPEGGFVARSSDPSMPTFEGATAEEVKQQIQAKLLEAIGARLGSALHIGSLKVNINGVEVHSTQQPTESGGTVWATSSSSGGPLTIGIQNLKHRASAAVIALVLGAAMLYWLMHR